MKYSGVIGGYVLLNFLYDIDTNWQNKTFIINLTECGLF